ncbi:unnamed protein product [Cuscuta europaea]|uniref:EIF3F/CSN6-like C-terminal domain-containing protein n=1 Tax=Cuscuta europaea TaxID=41803 RepID=A0A9P0ZJ80_CUSEU|nr:unnamed protein product [Cuscuta europaea]
MVRTRAKMESLREEMERSRITTEETLLQMKAMMENMTVRMDVMSDEIHERRRSRSHHRHHSCRSISPAVSVEFQEIPLDLRMIEAEQVGFDIMKKTAVDKLPNDLEGMEASMERMLVLINDVHKYVYDVVEGRIPTDNNLGRLLYETVNTIPKLSPPEFDKLVNDGLQDQ